MLSLPSRGKVLAFSPGTGQLTLADPSAGDGPGGRFTFDRSGGCATYPEAEISATGRPSRGKTPFGEVSGLLDAHTHMMAFEFFGGRAHCGRPWHRYGVPYALRDCPDHYPYGAGAILENTASFGNPLALHDPVGWPTFKDWPNHESLTHEQIYYKWLERAWMGGLRIFVNLLVENRVLCDIYPLKQNSCDEMDSIRLQAKRIRELENYIDAQSGGPGKGWFRIVTDPFEARRVVNEGKLAVVLGIETSEPFGCRVVNERPLCDEAGIDRGLDEVYALGVRDMELINKFDNALAGVAGDSGSLRRLRQHRKQALDRQVLADAALHRATGRGRPRAHRTLHPQPRRPHRQRPRGAPARRADARVSARAALQRARPHRSGRAHGAPDDRQGDDGGPRSPERAGPQEGDVAARGRPPLREPSRATAGALRTWCRASTSWAA